MQEQTAMNVYEINLKSDFSAIQMDPITYSLKEMSRHYYLFISCLYYWYKYLKVASQHTFLLLFCPQQHLCGVSFAGRVTCPKSPR